MTSWARWCALAGVAGLLLAACAGGPGTALPAAAPTETAAPPGCGALVSDLVDTMQRYVDGYAGLTLEEAAVREEPAGGVDLSATMQRFGERTDEAGCLPEDLRSSFVIQLPALEAEGLAAAEIVSSLRRSILAPETVRPFTGERQVAPDEDLADLLDRAEDGATLILDAGDHHLDTVVVLRRSVAIRGAGPDDTRIVSTAEGVGLLSLGGATVTIEGLTVAHEGERAASPLVIRSGGYDLRDSRFTGGRADDTGSGGSGVVIGTPLAYPLPAPLHGPRSEVTAVSDVEFLGNEGGGLAIVGAEAPTIDRVVARDNGACGVCFVGAQGGLLRDSTLEANRVGVSVGRSSRPRIVDNEVTGNGEAGVAFDGYGGGVLASNRIVDNGPLGVLVSSAAAPTIEGNLVRGHTEVGIAFAGDAAGQVRRNEVVDNDVGIQVGGDAAPTITENELAGEGRVALLLAESAAGEVSDNVCGGSAEAGLVLIGSADPTLGDNDCELLDQR